MKLWGKLCLYVSEMLAVVTHVNWSLLCFIRSLPCRVVGGYCHCNCDFWLIFSQRFLQWHSFECSCFTTSSSWFNSSVEPLQPCWPLKHYSSWVMVIIGFYIEPQRCFVWRLPSSNIWRLSLDTPGCQEYQFIDTSTFCEQCYVHCNIHEDLERHQRDNSENYTRTI